MSIDIIKNELRFNPGILNCAATKLVVLSIMYRTVFLCVVGLCASTALAFAEYGIWKHGTVRLDGDEPGIVLRTDLDAAACSETYPTLFFVRFDRGPGHRTQEWLVHPKEFLIRETIRFTEAITVAELFHDDWIDVYMYLPIDHIPTARDLLSYVLERLRPEIVVYEIRHDRTWSEYSRFMNNLVDFE